MSSESSNSSRLQIDESDELINTIVRKNAQQKRKTNLTDPKGFTFGKSWKIPKASVSVQNNTGQKFWKQEKVEDDETSSDVSNSKVPESQFSFGKKKQITSSKTSLTLGMLAKGGNVLSTKKPFAENDEDKVNDNHWIFGNKTKSPPAVNEAQVFSFGKDKPDQRRFQRLIGKDVAVESFINKIEAEQKIGDSSTSSLSNGKEERVKELENQLFEKNRIIHKLTIKLNDNERELESLKEQLKAQQNIKNPIPLKQRLGVRNTLPKSKDLLSRLGEVPNREHQS